MSKFDFETIIHELPSKWTERNFLWIWNADKIPPHVGLSVGKDYFSLTYKKSEHLQVSSMLKKAKRSSIPLVLVAFMEPVELTETSKIFMSYNRATPETTCLFPIKDVFQMNQDVKQLSDLLTNLKLSDRILDVYGVNLPNDYHGLAAYSLDDIQKRIDLLRSKI